MAKPAFIVGEVEKDRHYFRVYCMKKDDTDRVRLFYKINHALRALYRVANNCKSEMSWCHNGKIQSHLVLRKGRKRGFNTFYFTSKEGRPYLRNA
ncbi:MAG: hypothetical protein MN733_01450, partial [Nitrososphaera sp.]|nr:hypothetical protein [Nitrososphaera sp.]